MRSEEERLVAMALRSEEERAIDYRLERDGGMNVSFYKVGELVNGWFIGADILILWNIF